MSPRMVRKFANCSIPSGTPCATRAWPRRPFPGTVTLLHRHQVTEEIYHVTHGCGEMTLGEEVFAVAAGNSILIAPGTAHRVANTGHEALRILCCCAPAYSHADTELL